MVAEFVTRSQSGSPINGEIPILNSTMPGSQGREGPNGPNGFLNQEVVMRPVTPGTPNPDGFTSASSYELAAHIKRKELFSQRKQREFIPDNKKDDNYWDRRRRNNEAAKRSREKRRFNDMVLERRVVELTKENHLLKAQLDAIKEEYGICGENIVCIEKVMATLPTNEQVLSITKRPKLSAGPPSGMYLHSSPSPIPTPVIHQPVSHPVIGSPPPSVSHSTPMSAHHLHLHHPHPAGVLHETAGYNHHHAHHEAPEPYHRTPYGYQHAYPIQFDHGNSMSASNNNNALNLSSRSRSRSRSGSRMQSPFEISSGSGSGDEGVSISVPSSANQCSSSNITVPDSNNSLPLKLRHKSHLGDKEAASTLLSLQNIKQEPGPRSSPPWDGEGSSDERDSGISLGAEWSGNSAAAAVAAMASAIHKQSQLVAADDTDSENKHRLHSEIARLSTEVATLKSLVIRNKDNSKMPPSSHHH